MPGRSRSDISDLMGYRAEAAAIVTAYPQVAAWCARLRGCGAGMTGGMLSRGTTSWASPSRLGSVTLGMAGCMITRVTVCATWCASACPGPAAGRGGGARGGFERPLAETGERAGHRPAYRV